MISYLVSQHQQLLSTALAQAFDHFQVTTVTGHEEARPAPLHTQAKNLIKSHYRRLSASMYSHAHTQLPTKTAPARDLFTEFGTNLVFF
jgi:hypothetical protein